MFRHNFMGNRIVIAMIPVLDVLFCKRSVRRFLVPNDRVRALSATRVMVTHRNGH
jgi:peroxiredoxin